MSRLFHHRLIVFFATLLLLPFSRATDPVVRVNSIQVTEGDTGQSMARFTLRMEGVLTNSVDVSYATSNLTAIAAEDYEQTQGVLTFSDSQREQFVDVPVFGDTVIEPNETFQLVIQAPGGRVLRAQCVILNDDATAPAKRFVWDRIADGLPSDQSIQTQIKAFNLDGSLAGDFNGSLALSSVRGTTYSPVLITEVATSLRDAVEFQNVSTNATDISGWTVYFYDPQNWPAPTTTYVFKSGTTLAPKGLIVLADGLLSVTNYFVLQKTLDWDEGSAPSKAAVLLEDAQGNVRDFFAINIADTADIMDPHPIAEPLWNSVYLTTATGYSYQRAGNENHHSPRDWVVVSSAPSGGLASQNPGLVYPFVDSQLSPISPESASFTNGVWSGLISGLTNGAPAAFVAIDQSGREWYSNPITLSLNNDLSIAIWSSGNFVYSAPGTFISMSVSNGGPNISSNVVADLYFPGEFLQNSTVTTTISQGVVSTAGFSPEARVRASFGNIAANSAAFVTSNIPTLPLFIGNPVTVAHPFLF